MEATLVDDGAELPPALRDGRLRANRYHGFRCAPPVATFLRPAGAENRRTSNDRIVNFRITTNGRLHLETESQPFFTTPAKTSGRNFPARADRRRGTPNL